MKTYDPKATTHRCDICKQMEESVFFVGDAMDIEGYMCDACVCFKCYPKIQSILDEEGTQGLADYIEALP